MEKPDPNGKTPTINMETFLKMAKKGQEEIKAAQQQAPQPQQVQPQPTGGGAAPGPANQIPIPLKPLYEKMDMINVRLEAMQSGAAALSQAQNDTNGILFQCLQELQKLNAKLEQ